MYAGEWILCVCVCACVCVGVFMCVCYCSVDARDDSLKAIATGRQHINMNIITILTQTAMFCTIMLRFATQS